MAGSQPDVELRDGEKERIEKEKGRGGLVTETEAVRGEREEGRTKNGCYDRVIGHHV